MTSPDYLGPNTEIQDVKVSGRSLPVKSIVIRHVFMGESVQEIAQSSNLTLSDVHTVLAYYYDHQQEIDAKIDTESLREMLRKQHRPHQKQVIKDEKKPVSVFNRSAFVLGWLIQILVLLFLVGGVIAGINARVSLVFLKVGIDKPLADNIGKFTLISIYFGVSGVVWLHSMKVQQKVIRARDLFIFLCTTTIPVVLIVWVVMGPLPIIFSRMLGMNEYIVEMAAIALLWFILFLVERYFAYRRKANKAVK